MVSIFYYLGKMDGFRDVRLVGFTTLNEGILVTLACLALPLKNPINASGRAPGRAEGPIQCPPTAPLHALLPADHAHIQYTAYSANWDNDFGNQAYPAKIVLRLMEPSQMRSPISSNLRSYLTGGIWCTSEFRLHSSSPSIPLIVVSSKLRPLFTLQWRCLGLT